MERNDDFLKKEYLRNLFPIMFSVLGGTITSIIDSIMVSLKLGSDGLATLNLCMPVFLFLCSVGSLISGGSSIISARKAGDNEIAEGKPYYNTALVLNILLGVIITLIGIICCRPIANALAQGSALTQSVKEYILVLFIGAIPYMAAYLPLDYLQLEGKGKVISVMMALTIGIDIFLDWLFLFVFPFGYYGAAAASVISMLVPFLYGFTVLWRHSPDYHFKLCKQRLSDFIQIVLAGSSAAAANFFDAMKMFFLNAIILYAGGTKAIAVWAVINVICELSRTITTGVPQTASPMIAVFYSSKENQAIRLLLKIESKFGCIMISAFSLILLCGQVLIGRVYGLSESLFIPFLCLIGFLFLELFSSIWGREFYAIGRIGVCNLFSLFRSFLFPIFFAWLFTNAGGIIWLFLPCSALCSIVVIWEITNIIAKKTRTETHIYSSILLLDDYPAICGTLLEFSVKANESDICAASERISDFCAQNQMDMKMVSHLGLAIEEYLMIIKEYNQNLNSVDFRVTKQDETTRIRIRSSGTQYNPFDSKQDEDNIGITLLKNIASDIQYCYILGMNNIDFIFSNK